MKMGKFFYLGVGLCLAGIVLMSLPVKPCADCDDEAVVESDYIDSVESEEVTGD